MLSCRSAYKKPIIELDVLRPCDKKRIARYKTLFQRFTRRGQSFISLSTSARLSPIMLNKRIIGYNGKAFNTIHVKPSMIGLQISQIIRTKRCGSSIHLGKRKKKKNSR